jgi:hypothetical protein
MGLSHRNATITDSGSTEKKRKERKRYDRHSAAFRF